MKPEYKKRNNFIEVPPIQDLRSGEIYAITLNPKWENFPTKKNIMIFQRETYSNFKQLKNCRLKLYPELSDSMRPHLHGELTIQDLKEFLYIDYPYILAYGQVCIKPIAGETDEQCAEALSGWREYCTKGKEIMKNYLTLWGYPLDNNNLSILETGEPSRKIDDYTGHLKDDLKSSLYDDDNIDNARDAGI